MKNETPSGQVFEVETDNLKQCESIRPTAKQPDDALSKKKVKRRRTHREKGRYHSRKVLSTGVSRKTASAQGRITSLGTFRTYQDSISTMFKTIELGDVEKPKKIDLNFAYRYLEFRASRVSQKTLDVDRLALSKIFGLDTSYQLSVLKPTSVSRTYTAEQVELILEGSCSHTDVAVRLCYLCGLRAHELLTILPLEERSISLNRDWWPEQFDGMPDGELYSVIGKGGLIRPINISSDLANHLETFRLSKPVSVKDRGIFYSAYYDVLAGQNLSQQFSLRSKQVLGWSVGLHGLRHSYAQNRMRLLMALGYPFSTCLAIVSRELGHYRPDITKTYLR